MFRVSNSLSCRQRYIFFQKSLSLSSFPAKPDRHGHSGIPRLLPLASDERGVHPVRRDDAGLQDRRQDVRLRRHGELHAFRREVRPRPGRRVARALPRDHPAWHSSKRHWNDVYVTGDLPEAFLREQIRHSYLLVLQRNVVPKSLREEILRYIEEHEPPR